RRPPAPACPSPAVAIRACRRAERRGVSAKDLDSDPKSQTSKSKIQTRTKRPISKLDIDLGSCLGFGFCDSTFHVPSRYSELNHRRFHFPFLPRIGQTRFGDARDCRGRDPHGTREKVEVSAVVNQRGALLDRFSARIGARVLDVGLYRAEFFRAN